MLLALLTVLLYAPVRNFELINYDDAAYITENGHVKSGLTWEGVQWAFTTLDLSNWHPLTWISYMFDCQLFGNSAGAHHLVNAVIHVANTILLFLLLQCATSRTGPAFVVAAAFAWHPLHVESVAWVAERKDVLSTFFGLLALMAYTKSKVGRGSKVESQELTKAPNGGEQPRSTLDSRLSTSLCPVVLFALALMSKPMLVSLPILMLIFDVWPLKRVSFTECQRSSWRRLVAEKWPFIVLAVASCVVTLAAQRHGGSMTPLNRYSADLRVRNAAVSYVRYLWDTIWPAHLSIIYPLTGKDPWALTPAAIVLMAILTWLAWRFRSRWPCALAGWLWFLVALFPVIGIVQVGPQAMADRYMYLPSIGLFIAIVFVAADLATAWRLRPVFVASASALVLGTAWLIAARQIGFWRNSETVFQHAVDVQPDNYIAHNNLGMTLMEHGRLDGAIAHFNRAVELRPTDIHALHNLGAALLRRGQPKEAIPPLQKAAALDPGYAAAQYSLANALVATGKPGDAIPHYEAALSSQNENVSIHNNLAWVLATSQDTSVRNGPRAVQLAEQADKLAGPNPIVLGTLAAAYAETGRFAEATNAAVRALALARAKNDTNRMQSLRQQLAFYEAGMPYRDSTVAQPP